MDAPSLVNLAPLLRVMLLGLTVAIGPLAWWWLQHRGHGESAGDGTVGRERQDLRRLQVLTIFILFLTFDLVIFGAFTRLTDSGLGCPDWPGCYGHASPLGAQAHIDAAQSALPTGPVTHSKAWIEMLHRYLATGVGVLILTLTIYSWVARWRHSRSSHYPQTLSISPWWSTTSLLWVCLVGAFGALTVTLKLFPAIVTLHLLGALVLLMLLCKQVVLYTQMHAQAAGGHGRVVVSGRLRVGLIATFALLWLQIALGGWVSTNYAVLACNTFPMCQNSWWPSMNFVEGFSLWRELGLTSEGVNISFSALTAIHYTHRLVAYVLLLALGWVVWRLSHVAGLQTHARWLGLATTLQLVTGLSNVVLDWPLAAALLHTAGAAVLVILLTWTLNITKAHTP